MRIILSILISAIFLTGCVATKEQNIYSEVKINEEKIIAISAPRGLPWVNRIKAGLIKKGFRVMPIESQYKIKEKSKSADVSYNQSSARYVLYLDGQARMGIMHRCFGGGYMFDYISAELVDIKTNQTISSFADSGYSEGCPPLSGTLFADIVATVSKSWK